MRLHRFYLKNIKGKEVIAPEEIRHQLVHVFRYKKGERVVLFDGSGFDYLCEISNIDKKGVTFSLISESRGLIQKKITLCFSLIKKDNVELVLQKCTELGVTEFYPILTERSEKKAFNKERGEKIVVEAAEQSCWSVLPVLHDTSDLQSVIENTKKYEQIVLHTNVSDSKLLLKEEKGNIIALFIGPEGGWSEKEIEIFKENNIEFRSLGEQTLRAETAAIAGVVSLYK